MSWLECLYFYLRSGQPELFTDLDFHFLEIGIAGDYLLVKFIFWNLLFLSALVLVDIYEVRLLLYFISSIVFYVTLIFLYSSFMNYYFFCFRCTIITLCLWFYDFYLLYILRFAKFLFTTRYFEQFNSGMSVYLYTYNGCEWLKISGCYIYTNI